MVSLRHRGDTVWVWLWYGFWYGYRMFLVWCGYGFGMVVVEALVWLRQEGYNKTNQTFDTLPVGARAPTRNICFDPLLRPLSEPRPRQGGYALTFDVHPLGARAPSRSKYRLIFDTPPLGASPLRARAPSRRRWFDL